MLCVCCVWDEEENQSIKPRREPLHQELGGARAVVALVTKPFHLAWNDDVSQVHIITPLEPNTFILLPIQLIEYPIPRPCKNSNTHDKIDNDHDDIEDKEGIKGHGAEMRSLYIRSLAWGLSDADGPDPFQGLNDVESTLMMRILNDQYNSDDHIKGHRAEKILSQIEEAP